MTTIDERAIVGLASTPSTRATTDANKNSKKKTPTEVKTPTPTLRKQNDHNIVVTDADGKKHRIYFILGVPARVSGIGSLSKTYTKPFSTAQIALLQTEAYSQQQEARKQEFEENYNSWIKNTAQSPSSGEADDATALVHYRKSLEDEPMAYVNSRPAQDAQYGRYRDTTETVERGDDTYSQMILDYEGSYGSIFDQTPNSGSYRYVHKNIVPKKDRDLNNEPRRLAYSDYAELYARGKDGNRERIHQAIGLIDMNQQEYLDYSSKYYNRFKMPVPDAQLQRSFAHVFFVKPSCNINMNEGVAKSGDDMSLDQIFGYAWNHSPNIVKELSAGMSNSETQFSFMLSNAAASFSLADEYIDYDSYGTSYTGYKISFGRHDAESKTAGDFTVTFQDDNNINIYRLIKLWVDYIAGTYRGMYAPKDSTIAENIMDYAGACYYILTAEDGETILFWSKYYGVFPTTVPSTQYSWSRGTLLASPEIDVKFAYSFKEDYKVSTIVEFNRNANVQDFAVNNNHVWYEKTFNPELGSVGKTWVGAPFIESEIRNGIQTFKLRFRQPS